MIKVISYTKKKGVVVGAEVVIITCGFNGKNQSKTSHLSSKELMEIKSLGF